MAKKKTPAPTLEELQTKLAAAVLQLSEAFVNGSDEDVSSLTANVRACEQAIHDAYYRRWGTP